VEEILATVQVRYIVRDVDAAIRFYTELLGFHLDMHPAPPFAMLSRGDLRLLLSAPNASPGGGQAMPDGTAPQPGGWNRFGIQVDDLASMVARLRDAGAHFRNACAFDQYVRRFSLACGHYRAIPYQSVWHDLNLWMPPPCAAPTTDAACPCPPAPW